MAKILIHSDSASSATSVSNIFIDEFLLLIEVIQLGLCRLQTLGHLGEDVYKRQPHNLLGLRF